MRYKGYNFSVANSHYQLSKLSIAKEDKERFIEFLKENDLYDKSMVVGKHVPYKATEAGKIPKKAFKTTLMWNKGYPDETPMYATVLVPKGWSRTNMFYYKDKMVLGYNGRVFTASL